MKETTISFRAFGHPNMRSTHKATFEFTKDSDVTLAGDCIIGVNADFDSKKVREFIKSATSKENGSQKDIKVKITIEFPSSVESVTGFLNPHFCDEREIVVRRSDYLSSRTLVWGADKAAADFTATTKKEDNITVTIEIL